MSFWSRLFGPDHKPRMGGLEIFKYIGPGLLVTVGFIDPGNWASNLAAGAQYGYTLLWMVTLSTVMLIVLQHNVAHLGIATGPLPVGSGICIPQTRMVAPVAGFGRAGVDLHLAGRNPGRGDRIANAVRRTGAHRRAAGARVRGRHALHQQLPADRKMDHCLRLDHRAVVHLRTVAGNDRLAASRPGMGDALVPRRFDGHHHERIGRSGNAPQPVPTFGGDPEPPVEPERRRGHPQATALRVRRHDLLDAGGLGDQQRDDPAGRSDLLRDKNTCGGVAAGRFAPATAPGAKRDAYLCRRPALRGDLLDDHLGDGRGLDLRRDIQRALRHQGQPLPDGA